MRTPAEKRGAFMPLVREALFHMDDESVVSILGAAIRRRFVPPGSSAVSPDVHVSDRPAALDEEPPPEDRRPDLELLAQDAETFLVRFAETLPADEQPEFFRGIEDAATDVLKGRGLAVRVHPHH